MYNIKSKENKADLSDVIYFFLSASQAQDYSHDFDQQEHED